MRKLIIFFLFVLTIFTINSCKKREIAMGENFTLLEGDKIYRNISAISNIETVRLAYSNLSSIERLSLWEAKFTSILKSNTYSPEQRIKILEIKNYLNLKIFNEGDEREVFYTTWFPEWVTSAGGIFSNTEIYNLVFSLNEFPQNTDLVEGPKGCICALHSTFTCPKWTISIPPTLSFGTCKKIGECKEAASGCGALMDQECDGDACPDDITEE